MKQKAKSLVLTDFLRFLLLAVHEGAGTVLVVTRDIHKLNEEALKLLDFLGADTPAFRLNGRTQGFKREVQTRVKMVLPTDSGHCFKIYVQDKTQGRWCWVDGGDEAAASKAELYLSRKGRDPVHVERHWPQGDKAFITITPPGIRFVPQQ